MKLSAGDPLPFGVGPDDPRVPFWVVDHRLDHKDGLLPVHHDGLPTTVQNDWKLSRRNPDAFRLARNRLNRPFRTRLAGSFHLVSIDWTLL